MGLLKADFTINQKENLIKLKAIPGLSGLRPPFPLTGSWLEATMGPLLHPKPVTTSLFIHFTGCSQHAQNSPGSLLHAVRA